MPEYRFRFEIKNTIWETVGIRVEADTYREAKDKLIFQFEKDPDELPFRRHRESADENGIRTTYRDMDEDSSEAMSIKENGGNATIYLYGDPDGDEEEYIDDACDDIIADNANIPELESL